ncbi:hypothetical protein QTP88_002461 [Uroleucon formosanum]
MSKNRRDVNAISAIMRFERNRSANFTNEYFTTEIYQKLKGTAVALTFAFRLSEGCGDGEAFIKKYWYPPGCDFEGPLVFPLYRLHGLPVVLHRYPVFRINITQAHVHIYRDRRPSKVLSQPIFTQPPEP